MINKSIELKKARTGQAVLRAGAFDIKAGLAGKWIEKELKAYLVAMKRVTAQVPTVLGLTSDGARLGDPPEESYHMHVFVPEKNVTIVPMPQDQHRLCLVSVPSAG